MTSVSAYKSKNATQHRQSARQQAIIQPKLMVNAPGDRYEQEADAMADRVMRMQDTNVSTGMIGKSLQRKCDKCEEEERKKGGTIMRKITNYNEQPVSFYPSVNGNYIQRKCAKCEEEEKKKKNGMLMRKATTGGGFEAPENVSSRLMNSGGGSPLPDSTRLFMENAFSTDFSHVRIHTDSTAAAMNKEVNAKAFTYGSDIYFGSGQYNEKTIEGKKLLAHELMHTLQQRDFIQRDDKNNLLSLLQLQYPDPLSINQSIDPKDLTDSELVQEVNNIILWVKRNPTDTDQIINLEDNLRGIILEAMERNLNPFGHVDVSFIENWPWAFNVDEDALDIAISFEIYGGALPVEQKEAYDLFTTRMERYFLADPNLLKPEYKENFHKSMGVIFERDINDIEDKLFELRINGSEETWLISKIEWWAQTKDMLLDDGRSYFDAFLERLRDDKWYKDYFLWESSRKPYLDLLYNEVEEQSGELNTLIGQNSVKFGGYRPIWSVLDIKGEFINSDGTTKVNESFVKKTAEIVLESLEGYTSEDDSKIIRDSIKGLPVPELAAVLINIMKRYNETNWTGFIGKYGEAWEGGMLYWLFEDLEDDDIPIVAAALKKSKVLTDETIDALVAGRGWGGKYLPYTTYKAQQATLKLADCAENSTGAKSAFCFVGGVITTLWTPDIAGTTVSTITMARVMPGVGKLFPKVGKTMLVLGTGLTAYQLTIELQELISGNNAYSGDPLKYEEKIGRAFSAAANAILLGVGFYQAWKMSAVQPNISMAIRKPSVIKTTTNTQSGDWSHKVLSMDSSTGELVAIGKHIPTGEYFQLKVNTISGNGTLTRISTGETLHFDAGNAIAPAKGMLPTASNSSSDLLSQNSPYPLLPRGTPLVLPPGITAPMPLSATKPPMSLPGTTSPLLPLVATPSPAAGASNVATRVKTKVPMVQVGAVDIAAMRLRYGIAVGQNTLAVGKTDVPGLERLTFEGASRQIRAIALVPSPTPQKLAPRANALFVDHAEQDVVNAFIDAVENAGLLPVNVEGKTLAIHISNKTGVCVACRQGGTGSGVDPGILVQLSIDYPGLTIRVTWEDAGGVLRNLIFLEGGIY